MSKTTLAAARYAEDFIKVLKGLEPVRQRAKTSALVGKCRHFSYTHVHGHNL